MQYTSRIQIFAILSIKLLNTDCNPRYPLAYDTNLQKWCAIMLQNYAAITPAIEAIFRKITPRAIYSGLSFVASIMKIGSFYAELGALFKMALINIRKPSSESKGAASFRTLGRTRTKHFNISRGGREK
ncbi:hypothetical protein TNIN_111281 [Trichonephila inaurata madagascariensis]|uniref:Uncharacterized protein n=3 Tax=Trichonephila TaxID=2585208 RepID=A0A8X6XYC5_9ARAC|nr:hypothetical protein TNIN_111281 [Trichonephila inaurata madagascariensis]